jgi:yecA family protein
MQYFEKQREETLLRYLDKLKTRDAVLNYPQIQGLLYAMACSPEPIKPAEWFDLVWLNDDPQFENSAEAKGFYELLVDLFGSISAEVQRNRFQLGRRANIQDDALALADWCDGFLIGHHYLEDVWSVALDELDDDQLFEQVGETLDCAIAFVASDIADWDDNDEFLLTEFVRFQQLLQDYRAIHLRCDHDRSSWNVEQAFLDMQPVASCAACPCGSGRLFKDCCLH